MERHPRGSFHTLAACETCGRYVDVPLDPRGFRIAEYDHRADHHPKYPATFRELAGLLDPGGWWEKIIASYSPRRPVR